MNKMYWATGHTGGGDCLDGINGAGLVAGDAAIVIMDDDGTDKQYFYRLQASGATESSPSVIAPDSNPETKRWHLVNALTSGSVNVQAYGAKGDGITDDYLAFQAAVDSGAKTIIVPYTALGYVLNHKVTISAKDYVKFIGVGYPTIKTTWIDPPGVGSECQFYFVGTDTLAGYSKNCGVEGIIFDTSSMVGNVPTNISWYGNIGAYYQDGLTIKDCHWKDAISSGVWINQSERVLIDGCTAKGIHNYGWTGIALEGNFIQLYGAMEYVAGSTTRHWRGGNIITNCRFDSRSNTDYKTLLGAANYLYNWDDYGTSRQDKWHESNCAALITPFGLGADEPNAPFITFSNNHVRNFDVGVYSEPAGTMRAGKVIVENNTFYQNNIGIVMGYEGETIISGNYIYKCSNNAIQALPDSMVITNNLIIDTYLQGADVGWAIDVVNVGTAAQPVSESNVVISNNLIRQNTLNATNDNRFLGIRVGMNYSEATAIVKDVSIVGNSMYLKGSSAGSAAYQGGIAIIGNVKNVTIQGNTIRETPGYAISFSQYFGGPFGSPRNITVMGNTIDTVYGTVVIYLGDETTDVMISGNSVTSSRLVNNFVYDGTTGTTARRIILNNLIGDFIGSGEDSGLWTAAPTKGTWRAGDIAPAFVPVAGAAPGWVCTTSGTFSAATDNTGDTDGSTGVITGMTDTSDFAPGQYVSVSAGFATTGPYRIISKTATTITIEADSNSAESNITVSTPDPALKAMANLAA